MALVSFPSLGLSLKMEELLLVLIEINVDFEDS